MFVTRIGQRRIETLDPSLQSLHEVRSVQGPPVVRGVPKVNSGFSHAAPYLVPESAVDSAVDGESGQVPHDLAVTRRSSRQTFGQHAAEVRGGIRSLAVLGTVDRHREAFASGISAGADRPFH